MNHLNSGIYSGIVSHTRLTVKQHKFSYKMYMLGLDLDELDTVMKISPWLGMSRLRPLRFSEKDHGFGDPLQFKQRIVRKFKELSATAELPGTNVILFTQVRCFGLYFSPVNFYFLYKESPSDSQYMLAEVSNTPWNERHYYLVKLGDKALTDKTFPVSPFMAMDMGYRWKIETPGERLKLAIENIDEDGNKLFSANLLLDREPLSKAAIATLVKRMPMMTLKIKAAIYWQALKIWLKGVPFIGHPGSTHKQQES